MSDDNDSASRSPPRELPSTAALPAKDSNPYLHFIVSEIWAAAASVIIYTLFHAGSFLTELLARELPLKASAPAYYLGMVFAWGAALGASATFVLVTAYQLLVLAKKLWEGFKS